MHLFVILFMGGVWSRGGGACSRGLPAPGWVPAPGGMPAPSRISRPTPKGEIQGDHIQAHTQGGNSGGSDPGPHPRGKFRGIRSRPTPKGEIQGDQVQANIQGGNSGGSGPGQHPRGKFRGIRTSLPPDDYCCGRYASYWNAFLFFINFSLNKILINNKNSQN